MELLPTSIYESFAAFEQNRLTLMLQIFKKSLNLYQIIKITFGKIRDNDAAKYFE